MVIEHPEHPNHVDMPPPPPPPQLALNTNFDVGDTPDSPDLKPVPSEQLPIISPFLGRGLAGFDYIDYNTRAQDTEGAGEAASAEIISQGSTGSSTLRNDSLDDFPGAPEVVIVPVAEDDHDSSTNPPTNPSKLGGTKPPTTPGPRTHRSARTSAAAASARTTASPAITSPRRTASLTSSATMSCDGAPQSRARSEGHRSRASSR